MTCLLNRGLNAKGQDEHCLLLFAYCPTASLFLAKSENLYTFATPHSID
jgi:hypothetical protein